MKHRTSDNAYVTKIDKILETKKTDIFESLSCVDNNVRPVIAFILKMAIKDGHKKTIYHE